MDGLGAFDAALSRHQRERDQGVTLLSVLPLPPTAAAAAVGRWAMSRSMPLALVHGTSLEVSIRTIIESVSAAGLVQHARRTVADVAGRSLEAIDASFAARTDAERWRWLEELAAVRSEVTVAGWILTAFAGRRPLDFGTAPLPLEEMARAFISFAGPPAILVAPAPTAFSANELMPSIYLAATLAARFARAPLCLAAPRAILDEVWATAPESASIAMARQGLIDADFTEGRTGPCSRATVAEGRSKAERRLYEALNRNARTHGRFALSASLPVQFSERPAEVDLYDRELALAVEVDGWHHFQDPESYRRDRRKEVLLQRAGVFVMRFLEQDVWDRIEYLVDQVADAVTFRITTQSVAHRAQRR